MSTPVKRAERIAPNGRITPRGCTASARRERAAHGSRSGGPSLSVELWSFAIAEIDKWPLSRTRDQVLAKGIFQNVIRLLAAAFIMPQPVLEEVTLTDDAEFFGRPLLPFADDQFQRFA